MTDRVHPDQLGVMDLALAERHAPAVHRHTDPGPPETAAELAEWLTGAIVRERAFLADDDPGAIRADTQAEHRGALLAYQRVRDLMGRLLAEEQEQAALTAVQDRIDAAYKEAGYGEMPPLTQRLMDGDR